DRQRLGALVGRPRAVVAEQRRERDREGGAVLSHRRQGVAGGDRRVVDLGDGEGCGGGGRLEVVGAVGRAVVADGVGEAGRPVVVRTGGEDDAGPADRRRAAGRVGHGGDGQRL